MTQWMTSRAEAMKVQCPKCRAYPKVQCFGGQRNVQRKACHVERHTEAIRLGAVVVLPPNLRDPASE